MIKPVSMCSCCNNNNGYTNTYKNKPSQKKNGIKFKDVLKKEIEQDGKGNRFK